MPRDDARVDAGRLRRSTVLASIGEGVTATALPILAVGVTEDPFSVAAVVAVQHLPWPAVALAGPTALRRIDRRTLVGAVNTLRAVAVGSVALRAAAGTESLLLLLVAAFVLGLGEALDDDAGEAASPLVDGTAGSSLRSSRISGMIGLALVGMPLGGFLYELVAAVPFGASVLPFAVAALLALLLRHPLLPARSPGQAPAAGEGRPRAPGRSVAVVSAVAALATAGTSAVGGVLVLFALQDLGLGAPAFGLLLAGLCAAAAVGGLVAPEAARLLGPRRGVQASLLAVAVGHVVAALAADPRWPLVSAVALAVGTGSGMVAGLLARVLLQAVTGRSLAGTAARSFHALVWAAIPAGALAGGLMAQLVSVPFAVAVSGVIPLVGVGLASLVGQGTVLRPARPKRDRPPLVHQQIPEIQLTGPAPSWSDARVRSRRVDR